MRIGIITFHDGFNYGGFAQAFALSKTLLELGHDVEIINYKPFSFSLKEYKVFLGTISPRIFIKNAIKIMNFKRDQKMFVQTKWVRDISQLDKQYDHVFLGSDSVFNYTNPLIGFDPVYFGQGVPADKISSYAASFGPDKYDDGFPDLLEDLVPKLFKVGVRDENSKQFITKLNSEATEVLDPTFLLDFSPYLKEPDINNYLLVYSYKLTEDEIKDIVSFSKESKLKIVSVGYNWQFADVNYDTVGPFEWLGLIKGARFVVTGMYHGTLLSIQMNKEFVSLVTPYRKNKINHILSKFSLQSRMIESEVENQLSLGAILAEPINYPKVNKSVEDCYSSSMGFIKECLES